MQSERVDEMQILMKIGDYFSHLNSATQKNVSETMKPVCNAKVTGLFGRNVFEELHTIYEHFGATQNVYTKYREFVARLQSERERNQAERVWSFCKKIYRISVFKPAFLTVWLGAEQVCASELGFCIAGFRPDLLFF
ncbi:unnamed protein product [Anisakis simplex]|uniref:NPA domain-containing protein n=1 Tax=Anisakis simplex TaxID=6269 RepID=A0A0M3JBL2_ANISI|nr:unnamed protein product [Anisakis simplex]